MVVDLPDLPNLLRISKAIAMLDAIICRDWQYRYYSFNSKWSPGKQMASMRNGSGDEYFVLFTLHGAILKGYCHESPAARWCVEHNQPMPGMFDGVPQELEAFLHEPAFSINDTTFCQWRTRTDNAWSSGTAKYPANTDGGAADLLRILQGDPDLYATWARDYFGRPVNANSARRIYQPEALTEALVHSLNSEVTLEDLQGDIDEIAYGC